MARDKFSIHGWEVWFGRVGIRGEYCGVASKDGRNIHTLRFGGRGAKARARAAIIAGIDAACAEGE